MKIGIGIDTGGTYTDAVAYDFSSGSILQCAKSPTTKEDLSIGIIGALSQLDASLLGQAATVSLSTTLATNACVEGKGGRSKLLFIGVDPNVVSRFGTEYGLDDTAKLYFAEAITTIDGRILSEPDWERIAADMAEFLTDAEALGIVELNAPKNGALLEKKAKELIAAEYNLPIVCGHEIFSDLNSVKRGSSTLLNGRLMPIMADFIAAIKRSFEKLGIKAPVVVMRSDGSLMSESFTRERPVEAILSGPAASTVGGLALTKANNAIICDMGGTTTDISLIRDMIPVISDEGIAIGNWQTFVKGFYVSTFGLGGDSTVMCDKYGKLFLGERKAVPLCAAAMRYPKMKDDLRALLSERERHTLPLYQFFMGIRDISSDLSYNEHERNLTAALMNGPLIFSDAAAAAGCDEYNFNTARLENEGIIIRCALTPTDMMHIKGDFSEFDREASILGARFLAKCAGLPEIDALVDWVYNEVKRKIYYHIGSILIKEDIPEVSDSLDEKTIDALLFRAWEQTQSGIGQVDLRIKTDSALVGIGAPIHVFLPDVAKALGCECIIPENAGVINAVGAVAGNITASVSVSIRRAEDVYIAFCPGGNREYETLDEATNAAFIEAEKAALEEISKRGAGTSVRLIRKHTPIVLRDGYNTELFIENRITVTAISELTI